MMKYLLGCFSLVIALQVPVQAAVIAVFDNATYVDTTSGPAASSDALQALLTALGHTVVTFTGTTEADFTAATSTAQLILFPDLLLFGILANDLTAPARTALANYVTNGGGLIAVGGNAHRLLNVIFYPTCDFVTTFCFASSGTLGPSVLDAAVAAGTPFASAPATLSVPPQPEGAINPFAFTPGSGLNLYRDLVGGVPNSTTVLTAPFGAGRFGYLGWGFADAAPLGSFDGGWGTVLDLVVQDVADTTVPGTAPTVDAGPDVTITLPASAMLLGTTTDDGLPNPPGAVTVMWSQVGGPGPVTFANANATTTTASFAVAGTYVVRLTASDGILMSTDDATITVQPGPPGNQAPTADAGPPQALTLPPGATTVTVQLDGSGSTDQDGSIASLQWTGNPDPVDVVQPTVTLGIGTHTFTLVVTDNQGARSHPATVTITVQPPPRVPELVVDATTLDFGRLRVEETATQSVTMDNQGTADLVLGQLGLTGPDAGAFRFLVDACSGQTLRPDSRCKVTLGFTPTAVSVQRATLNVPSNDPDTATLAMTLRGEGVGQESAFVLPLTPEDGQTVGGDRVTVAVLDDGVPDGASVIFQFRAVGTTQFTPIGQAFQRPFMATWDITGLQDGDYELLVTLVQQDNQRLDAPIIQVSIVNVNPAMPPDVFEDVDTKMEHVQANEEETVITFQGIAVLLPVGVLHGNDRMTIQEMSADRLPGTLPGIVAGKATVDITLESRQNTFRTPLTIRIPYADADQDGIVDDTNPPGRETDVTLWFFDTTAASWRQVLNARVLPEANVVEGMVDHFTTFGVFQPIAVDGGGCTLMPAGPWTPPHILAALGNILLPVLVVLGLWVWRRRRPM